MSSIKSRYIWILIVLVTAFTAPVRGQVLNGSAHRNRPHELMRGDYTRAMNQRQSLGFQDKLKRLFSTDIEENASKT